MSSADAKPSPAEIMEQLRRMLASRRFRNASKQSKFLPLAVTRALEGKGTSGRVVAATLFPGTFLKDESTNVRVTASNLRAGLKKYYEAEGSNDPVRILMPDPSEDKSIRAPRGKAYSPTFTYNPLQAVNLTYRVGEALLSIPLNTAVEKFREVMELAPEHVGGMIGLAEAWCSSVSWLNREIHKVKIDELTREGLSMMDRVLLLAPKLWKAYAVIGSLCTVMDRLDLAKEAYQKALSLSRASTESYPPYLIFLAKTNEANRAVRLADLYLESRFGDPNAHVAYADVLLYSGRFDDASQALESAFQLHGNVGTIHHRLFVLRLKERRIDDAVRHFNRMIPLLDPFALESTVESVKLWVKSLPQKERKAWNERMKQERELEEATAKAIARVRAALKR
jgi:tetratricopeptide (TPR) repeat protein